MNPEERPRRPEHSDVERPSRESAVRQRMEAGDMQSAAAEAITLYGPEIMRFLRVRFQDRDRAEEAFSQFCEDLWMGLVDFSWRSSLRTWMFVLARHAAARHARANLRERRREAPGDSTVFAAACESIRTETAAYLRTHVKHQLREMRQQLDDDQQTLLILRVERGLAWRELAIVMGEVAADASESELKRASARVRSRYQVAKDRLRELALQAGLIKK